MKRFFEARNAQVFRTAIERAAKKVGKAVHELHEGQFTIYQIDGRVVGKKCRYKKSTQYLLISDIMRFGVDIRFHIKKAPDEAIVII